MHNLILLNIAKTTLAMLESTGVGPDTTLCYLENALIYGFQDGLPLEAELLSTVSVKLTVYCAVYDDENYKGDAWGEYIVKSISLLQEYIVVQEYIVGQAMVGV